MKKLLQACIYLLNLCCAHDSELQDELILKFDMLRITRSGHDEPRHTDVILILDASSKSVKSLSNIA
jgi:hypothetical protein